MLRMNWRPSPATLIDERRLTARLQTAHHRIGRLLVRNMRTNKKWQNRTGIANASLNYRIGPSAYGLINIDLYGTAFYLHYLEEGARQYSPRLKWRSMQPTVEATMPTALVIAMEAIMGR